jgi:hypothetical protein
MANAYTRFAPNQYQSQYTPAPLEQIAPAMQYASGLRQQSQLADARTKKLTRSMLGSAQTPEELALIKSIEEKHMGEIAKRAERGYSSQDAIEVELQAEEAAESLGSIQSSREAVQKWEEEMRELNQDDVNPTTLETLIGANRPQIQYDQENLRATAQSAPVSKITPDLDLAAHVAENVKDIKPILTEQGIDYNPDTGQFVEVDPDGNIRSEIVSPDRIRRAAGAIIESGEAQEYLARERAVNQLQAQQAIEQGQNPVDAYLDMIQPPEDASEEMKIASKDLQNFVANERDKGKSDAEIYATIKEREEINNALGFANTKYAYTDVRRRTVSGDNRKRSKAMGALDAVIGPASNNVNTAQFKMDLDDLEADFTGGEGYYGKEGYLGMPGGQLPAEQKREIDENKDPREWAESSLVKNKYGNSVAEAMDMAPKEKGESNSAYLSRIRDILTEQSRVLESEYLPYTPIEDEDEREAINERMFGKNSEDRLGDITDMSFVVSSPGEETDVLSYDALLKHFDISPEEAKEKLFDYANVLGVVESGDPQLGSAMEIAVTTPDTATFGNNSRNLRIRASRPKYFEQESVRNKIALSNLRTSPKSEEFIFEDTVNLDGNRQRYKFRAIPRNVYGGETENGYEEYYQDEIPEDVGINSLSFRRREVMLEQLDEDGNIVTTLDDDFAREIEKHMGL